MSLHPLPFLLLLFYPLLALPRLVLAQSPSPPPFPSLKPTYGYDHDPTLNYFGSTRAPLSRILLKPPHNLSASYTALLSFITYVELAVRHATDHFSENTPLTTCNHRDDGWSDAVNSYFYVRGLSLPDTECISDIYGTTPDDGIIYPENLTSNHSHAPPHFTSRSIYNLIVDHSQRVEKAAPLIEFPGWSNSTDPSFQPTRARDFRYNVRTQQCRYDYAAFVFVQGAWFVAERITNAPQQSVRHDRQRRFAYEFIRPDSVATAMRFRGVHHSSDSEVSHVTTSLANYTGSVVGSAFSNVFAANNLAVIRALQRGEHQTQQALDATTLPNLAILAFPLVMNLVPVALIADVNTVGMLLYTLLTDILTAVPLAIKGIEVLASGKRIHHAVVTRMSGEIQNNTPITTKAAEVWVAQCRTNSSLAATGVTLLVIALLFMVGGISAEFWAKSYVRRNRPYGSVNTNTSSIGTTHLDDDGDDDDDSTNILLNDAETGYTLPPTLPPTTASASATAAVLGTVGRTGQDAHYRGERGRTGGNTTSVSSLGTTWPGNNGANLVAGRGRGEGAGVTKRAYVRRYWKEHYGSIWGAMSTDVDIGARGIPPEKSMQGRHEDLQKRA